MSGDEWPEDGWPARDFDEDARAYLLSESRTRVQELLTYIGVLDVKIAALFTASAVLVTVGGLIGDLRFDGTGATILTSGAFFVSLLSWLFLGIAYWSRNVGVGIDPRVFRVHYTNAPEQELRDAALESAVEDFGLNQDTINSKAKWLRRAFLAVAIQLVLVFASIVATSVADASGPEAQRSFENKAQQSSATGLDRTR